MSNVNNWVSFVTDDVVTMINPDHVVSIETSGQSVTLLKLVTGEQIVIHLSLAKVRVMFSRAQQHADMTGGNA